MRTTLTGNRLLAKLAECPTDAYPHGVSEDAEGNIVIDCQLRISPVALYTVTDNVRGRDADSVNTIDSDWSVSLGANMSRTTEQWVELLKSLCQSEGVECQLSDLELWGWVKDGVNADDSEDDVFAALCETFEEAFHTI